jgi:hypothetical protein
MATYVTNPWSSRGGLVSAPQPQPGRTKRAEQRGDRRLIAEEITNTMSRADECPKRGQAFWQGEMMRAPGRFLFRES